MFEGCSCNLAWHDHDGMIVDKLGPGYVHPDCNYSKIFREENRNQFSPPCIYPRSTKFSHRQLYEANLKLLFCSVFLFANYKFQPLETLRWLHHATVEVFRSMKEARSN